MKTYIFIPIVFICLNLNAQIVFEHAYDSSSTIQGNGNPKISQLMIIKFEISGERYVRINCLSKKINIYNMNHSLLKTIDCSSFPVDLVTPPSFMDVLYLSETLFDEDPDIDFMWVTRINNSG